MNSQSETILVGQMGMDSVEIKRVVKGEQLLIDYGEYLSSDFPSPHEAPRPDEEYSPESITNCSL